MKVPYEIFGETSETLEKSNIQQVALDFLAEMVRYNEPWEIPADYNIFSQCVILSDYIKDKSIPYRTKEFLLYHLDNMKQAIETTKQHKNERDMICLKIFQILNYIEEVISPITTHLPPNENEYLDLITNSTKTETGSPFLIALGREGSSNLLNSKRLLKFWVETPKVLTSFTLSDLLHYLTGLIKFIKTLFIKLDESGTYIENLQETLQELLEIHISVTNLLNNLPPIHPREFKAQGADSTRLIIDTTPNQNGKFVWCLLGIKDNQAFYTDIHGESDTIQKVTQDLNESLYQKWLNNSQITITN